MATKQDSGTTEIPLDEVLPGNGGDEPQDRPTVIKTIVTQGKGKPAGARVLSNRDAIDAIASLGGSGSSIWVERLEPTKHDGKRVQTGKLINVALTPDDLTKNLPQTLQMLGRRGRLFKIGAGDRSAPLEVAGGALDMLDYEPDASAQTMIVPDAYGRPTQVTIAAPPVAQLPFSPMMGFHPQGQGLSAQDIAKAIAEAIGGSKKSEAYELRLLEVEQRRQEREERADKERKDREEKAEAARREKEERVEKERKDKEEREERRREDREKAEKEERTRREKEERDERTRREEKDRLEKKEQKEREDRDRADRDRRDSEAREREEKARERQYQLMLQASKDQQAMVQSLVTAQSAKDEGLIDKMVKLRQIDGSKDRDPFRDWERIAGLIRGGGEGGGGWAEALVNNLPELVRAAAELKMAPPGVPLQPAQVQQATATVQQNPPAQVAHRPTMDLAELLDAIKSIGEAVEKKYSPAEAVKAFRRERAQGGVPNFCAVCATQTPEALANELKKVYDSPKLPDEQKAQIAGFYPIATSDLGRAWILEFFAEVRKA